MNIWISGLFDFSVVILSDFWHGMIVGWLALCPFSHLKVSEKHQLFYNDTATLSTHLHPNWGLNLQSGCDWESSSQPFIAWDDAPTN